MINWPAELVGLATYSMLPPTLFEKTLRMFLRPVAAISPVNSTEPPDRTCTMKPPKLSTNSCGTNDTRSRKRRDDRQRLLLFYDLGQRPCCYGINTYDIYICRRHKTEAYHLHRKVRYRVLIYWDASTCIGGSRTHSTLANVQRSVLKVGIRFDRSILSEKTLGSQLAGSPHVLNRAW